MQKPVQIVFRNIDASPALDALVRDQAASLEQLSDAIIGCHVAIEAASKAHRHGNQHQVRIELKLPGETLVASHGADDPAHEDAYVAVRDAFAVITRQLRRYTAPNHRGCGCGGGNCDDSAAD